MAITLQDIHKAVDEYMNNLLIVTITTPPTAEAGYGNTINAARSSSKTPGDPFHFSAKVRNALDAEGGVALMNVIVYVQLNNTSLANLYAPTSGWKARADTKGYDADGKLVSSGWLTAGAEVKEKMYLYPEDGTGLGVVGSGHEKEITISGKAKDAGNTGIDVTAFATVNMSWLFAQSPDPNTYPAFPHIKDTISATAPLAVVPQP